MATPPSPSAPPADPAPAPASAPARPRASGRATNPPFRSTGEELVRRLWTEDLPHEHGFEPLDVEGALPAELRGTLYRNGPGLFGQHGRRYSHPFEGDGAVTAVRFEGGRVKGASKVTPTAGLLEERAAGRMLYGFSAPWTRRVGNMMKNRL
jgi:all-trans-8'-apo-beta-carotenal 15,15'-oxygenase